MEKKYADELLSMGSIRVGTIEDFREADHKGGVKDSREGKINIKTAVNNLVLTEGHSDLDKLNTFGNNIRVTGGGKLIIGNYESNNEHTASNCFIYCVAGEEQPSIRTQSQFEMAEACVEIIDPIKFQKVLKSLIYKKMLKDCKKKEIENFEYLNFTAVTYGSSFEHREFHEGGLLRNAPALLKNSSFVKQNEYRAICKINPIFSQYIEPFYPKDIDLIECCRLIELERPFWYILLRKKQKIQRIIKETYKNSINFLKSLMKINH